MIDPTTAAVVATTVLVVGFADKCIQIWYPNSRINNVFDVVAKIILAVCEQLAPTKKPPAQ